MVKQYECKNCKFTTTDKCGYNVHKKTKKHILRNKQQNRISISDFLKTLNFDNSNDSDSDKGITVDFD